MEFPIRAHVQETGSPVVAVHAPADRRLCHAARRGARRCQAVPALHSKDTPYLSLAHRCTVGVDVRTHVAQRGQNLLQGGA
eukprot:364375-Chlamydomonas_euryale.AAC.1